MQIHFPDYFYQKFEEGGQMIPKFASKDTSEPPEEKEDDKWFML